MNIPSDCGGLELGCDKWVLASATQAAQKPRFRATPACDLGKLREEARSVRSSCCPSAGPATARSRAPARLPAPAWPLSPVRLRPSPRGRSAAALRQRPPVRRRRRAGSVPVAAPPLARSPSWVDTVTSGAAPGPRAAAVTGAAPRRGGSGPFRMRPRCRPGHRLRRGTGPRRDCSHRLGNGAGVGAVPVAARMPAGRRLGRGDGRGRCHWRGDGRVSGGDRRAAAPARRLSPARRHGGAGPLRCGPAAGPATASVNGYRCSSRSRPGRCHRRGDGVGPSQLRPRCRPGRRRGRHRRGCRHQVGGGGQIGRGDRPRNGRGGGGRSSCGLVADNATGAGGTGAVAGSGNRPWRGSGNQPRRTGPVAAPGPAGPPPRSRVQSRLPAPARPLSPARRRPSQRRGSARRRRRLAGSVPVASPVPARAPARARAASARSRGPAAG